jgi:hypothetical protein
MGFAAVIGEWMTAASASRAAQASSSLAAGDGERRAVQAGAGLVERVLAAVPVLREPFCGT